MCTYLDSTEDDNSMPPGPPVAGGSRAYALAGLSPGEIKGDAGDDAPEALPFSLGDGPNLGEADPFCLVRFICKHRSG